MVNKVYSSLSLARKAGMLQSGDFGTEQAITGNEAYLVLIAEDASDNTKKKFKDKCTYYRVPFQIYGTKGELGHALGKEMRSCLAVTDKGFAKMIEDQLSKEGVGGDMQV